RKGGDDDLQKRASLLRRDSVHGPFAGTISVDEEDNAIIANGNFIRVIYSNDPSSVDYTQYGINNAVLIDNTGIWRDEAGLQQHLQCPGIDRVILTAPGKGDMKNIVHGVKLTQTSKGENKKNFYGVNKDNNQDADKVISCAWRPPNAIVPPPKAVEDKFCIVVGQGETVHAYTNDQNLLDNYHKGPRRGR